MTKTTFPNRFSRFAAAAALLALGSVAQADPIPASWSDEIIWGDPGQLVTPESSFTYTHDLTDDGFTPLEDLITGFQLIVNAADDESRDGWEVLYLDLPGILGDRVFFDLSGEEYGGWSFVGWIELNVFGTLTVTATSLYGDFELLSSTLYAYGLDAKTNSVSVPEPGTLALLGAGLLGLALARRRRPQPQS